MAQTPDPAFEQLKSYQYGRDTSAIDKITALVEQARGNASQRNEVAAELASVLTSSASFDAKQFACRQLVFVAGEAQIQALATLLSDGKLCHYSLMALAKIPGKAVNDALVSHIGDTKDRNKLELLSLLAERGDARAVPGLASQLAQGFLLDEGFTVAATGLATIANSDAVSALTLAYTKQHPKYGSRLASSVPTHELFPPIDGAHEFVELSERIVGSSLVRVAYTMLFRGDKVGASRVFSMLEMSAEGPSLKAVALRGMVLTSPKPADIVAKALGEDGTPRQRMAADLVREIPGSAATKELSAALPNLTLKGQLLLLTALGDRGDHAAATGVMSLCKSKDEDVRLAAIRALGKVGDSSTVTLLLDIAAGGGPDRDAARDSIGRLRGTGNDEVLMRTLTSSGARPALVAEAITALGLRRATAATPALLHAASDKNSAVSSAAFAVLRDIAPTTQLQTVLTATLSMPSDSRDSAVEACTEIARRGVTEQERTGALLRQLEATAKAADRLTLLTILDSVGGPKALAALEKATTDTAPAVQDGALALLAEWPTDEPLDVLLKTARGATDSRRKTIAIRGCLKMIAANETRPPERSLALLKEVMKLSSRADDKRQALSSLGKIPTLEAMNLAIEYVNDSEVGAEAANAISDIGRVTIGAFPAQTTADLMPIAASGSNDTIRKKAVDILALPAKAADFVTAWEVSPSYQQDGADYKRLFDIPFPPEIPASDKDVPWRLMPIVTSAEQPWLLDLLALWGGEQRVAYLRTAVKSDAAREVTLELGSDDGIKAWANGAVVLADNTARGITPGQENVKVHLKAGWNTILLKITQNVMGWGACCRITDEKGETAKGLSYSVPSAVLRQ